MYQKFISIRLRVRKGFTLIELLVVIAIIAILAAILFPVFARAREKARQSTCTSNQRQIAASLQMFAQDHEEMLPGTANVWSNINVDPGVLVCPTKGKSTANGYGYNYFYLDGISIGSVSDPSSAVLTIDSDSSTNTVKLVSTDVAFRHSSKAIASYLDGHVQAVIAPIVLNPMAIKVTNYSWLQLPIGYLSSAVGGTVGFSINQGSTADIMYSRGYGCVPNAGQTGDYWGTLTLDQPRNVTKVRVRLYATASSTCSKLYIMGSFDNTNYGMIGTYTSPITSVSTTEVAVTPGIYQSIRVYFKQGEYSGTTYGGPGFIGIEPFGSGSLNANVPGMVDEVNWANASFNTTATCNGFSTSYTATTFNDGSYTSGVRSGYLNAPWPVTTYATIDLGSVRTINKVIMHGDWSTGNYSPTAFTVSYSNDGTTFTTITGTAIALVDSIMSGYSFTATPARYWRISNATGAGATTHHLLNQIMIYGPG